MLKKGDKRVINAWAMYDWSNSVYNLVITATIFPIYYSLVAVHRTEVIDGHTVNMVNFMGIEWRNTALYDIAISVAYLFVAFLAPFLSGIADSTGNKERFMQFFTYMGAGACVGMFFFDESNLGLGILLVILAVMGYAGSLVFYNSYLPEIAEPEDHDRISAKGFSLGYFGSSLLLIACLLFVMNPQWLFDVESQRAIFLSENPGIRDEDLSTMISAFYMKELGPYIFLTVGIWWAGFAQITFRRLPNNVYGITEKGRALSRGYKEIKKVWGELRANKTLKRFLSAFFVYNMGVQTVMLVAVMFAKEEVKMEGGALITTILIIQFVAMLGAFLFSRMSKWKGNVFTLKIAVAIWFLICCTAYFVTTVMQFYILAAVVGLVMGGIQSLSRSTYSKFLPDTMDHASYFSFYDLCEKLGIVLGLGLFGIIDQFSGMRNAVIALVVFFALGWVLLQLIPRKQNEQTANS